MKKLFSFLVILSLLFLYKPAFAVYPTATPHLLNKGNMLSSPANPYIGDKTVAALFYGVFSSTDSPYYESSKTNTLSLSTDIPFPALGESVISLGYEGLNTTMELNSKPGQTNKVEIERKSSTFALQFSSKIGEAFKGSVKVRMEKEEENSKTNDESTNYNEFDIGLNYTLPNHCEIGLHVSPKGDSDSTDFLQAGFGCKLGKSLAVGADINRSKEGEHDAKNGLVLAGEYLYDEMFDIELIFNLYEEEKEAELALSYLVSSFLLRARYIYIDVDEEHVEHTNHMVAVGVVGSF